MIEVRDLTKRFGETVAVDQLSFGVRPGVVTGFLGPNGAGKSTTMRMILGLDRPTSGSVTVNGKPYVGLPAPMYEVGALLEARALQGGRSAYQHLRWIAQASRIPRQRVDAVLDTVGLTEVAHRRAGGFSLGMSQRLGIASALLGDPPILLFDEPVNGLDPEGILWIRTLMKQLAGEGRTVFVSSHLMNEMQETADHVLVIGRGRLIADTSIEEFTRHSSSSHVRVVSPDALDLTPLLEQEGATVRPVGEGVLNVVDLEANRIGDIAWSHRLRVHQLSPHLASLEAAFMELTRESVEFQGAASAREAAGAVEAGVMEREGRRS